jgi:hypothetical protein
MSDLSCERMHELAPELALDILSGYERATAQAHLNECPSCRAYVSSLTQVSDRLLTLVPSAEPPVGFEDRVLSKMGLTPPKPRQQRRWFPIAVAAAVAALIFGVGGWVIGDVATSNATFTAAPSNNDPDQVIRFAALRTSTHHQIGQVFTFQGTPSWVYMSIAAEPQTDWVACQLIQRNGHVVNIGSFNLSGGKGSWGNEVPVDPNSVASARIITASGTVLASATFGNSGEAYLGHPR